MVNGPQAGDPTRHGPETRPRAERGTRTRHHRETGAAAAGLALWRFHLRAGVRLALRVMLPPVVAALGAAYLLGPDWVCAAAQALFGGAGCAGGRSAPGGARLAVPLLALAAAATAARRVRVGLGAGGWLRQLPVGGAAQRRAAAAAVTVAQAPVAAVLAAFAVLAASGHAAPAGHAAPTGHAAPAATALATAGMARVPASAATGSAPAGIASAPARVDTALGAARHAGAPAQGGGAANLPLALSGLALACLAAALCVTPSRRPWLARPLALAGALASCAPDWALLAAGGVLALAGDLGAGGLPRRGRGRTEVGLSRGSRRRPAPATPVDGFRAAAPPALPATTAEKQDQPPGWPAAAGDRAGHRTPGEPSAWPPASARPGSPPCEAPPPRWLLARIAGRALGWRMMPAFAAGLAPLVAAAAFLQNDSLTPRQRLGAALLGGGAGMALLLAGLSRQLAAWRPPWPWARSLPWSARRRVAADAALLAVPALALAAVAAGLDADAAAAVLAALLALLPLLAVLAAGAVRGGVGAARRDSGAGGGTVRRDPGAALRDPGAAQGTAALEAASSLNVAATGQVLWYGLLAAGVVALQPWLSAAALALTPAALAVGASRERRGRVGRWQPAGHLAPGDTQSGSGD